MSGIRMRAGTDAVGEYPHAPKGVCSRPDFGNKFVRDILHILFFLIYKNDDF